MFSTILVGFFTGGPRREWHAGLHFLFGWPIGELISFHFFRCVPHCADVGLDLKQTTDEMFLETRIADSPSQLLLYLLLFGDKFALCDGLLFSVFPT